MGDAAGVSAGVTIEPVNDGGGGETVWLPQVHRLYEDIRLARGVLTPRERDTGDARPVKGVETVVSLALGAGAIPAVAGVLRAWLRDRRRSITVTTSQGRKIVINGMTSDDELLQALRLAVTKDGEGVG